VIGVASAPSLRAVFVFAVGVTLLAVGCEGGTLINHSQRCSSTGGLLAEETIACSGTAETLRGSVGIEFGAVDEDEELLGTYRLTAMLSVGRGEAGVYAYDADGERVSLGHLSEDEPLRVEAVVDPFGDSSVFFVDAGEGEVRDLRYEGTIEPV
jgi:hypothetical protein